MSPESRRLAGTLLVVLPTVVYGETFLLSRFIDSSSVYMQNPLR